MQIKEVEVKTGMPRANIRYYEKQGLLNQTLRNVNNRREYSEEDVEQLCRIKILRILEVPMEEIRLYKNDKEKLNQIIREKMKGFQEFTNFVLSNDGKRGGDL